MGRPEAVASCVLQAFSFSQGATYWCGGWGISRISWANSPVIGSVCFHVGEGSKVCGGVKIDTDRKARGKWLGMELKREYWVFSAVSLSLLSSQDWLCNWVPSCYFGDLSFNVSCHHLRSEHIIVLSSLWSVRAPCKDEGQCYFENDLGNSKLS